MLDFGDLERARDLLGETVADAMEVLDPQNEEDWQMLEDIYGEEAVKEERKYRRQYKYLWEES